MLAEVIDSVISQDYPHIEYIILDDGSTDQTVDLLKKYGKKIKWVNHKNMGETKTTNKGLEMSTGEIVAVVNSDDPLLPKAVSTAVEFLTRRSELLAAYPDWNLIDEHSQKLETIEVPPYSYLKMYSRYHCLPGPGAFIRRKAFDLIGYRDASFKYVADFDFWLRLGMYGPMAKIPRVLATFRTHAGSQSVYAKNDKMAEEHIRLVTKISRDRHLPKNARWHTRQAYSSAYFHAAGTYATKSKMVNAYLKSLMYSPTVFAEKMRYEAVKIKKQLFT